MYTLQKTNHFINWLLGLKDLKARARIQIQLTRMEQGNLGDHKSVGDGVFEIRISYGPGYRLYYSNQSNVIKLLLIGGDKSTQEKDIQKAKTLLKEIENENAG